MDFSTILTLIQTILQVLKSFPLLGREIKSLWGYESQLKNLENTMLTIQAVLLEAERQQRQQLQELSFPLQVSLEKLSEALYDANDLFDEMATVVQGKNLMSGNTMSKEVRLFFSRFNQLYYAFTKSHEVKKIKATLDAIANDYSKFGSMITHHGGARTSQVSSNPRETSSLLCEADVIIGRDDDKRVVIDMLLNTAVEESVSCVSIVGIGGLGKTTLAQLVYNDEKVKREFQARMWVCVSNDFDVRALLAEILAVATNQHKQDGLNMDQLHTRIQRQLDGKKYLLVLDDVWGDVDRKWQEIRRPLIGGRSRGSRILVTTRSLNVAQTVGGQRHELKGLSEAESWNLFERMTLKSRHEMEALDGEKILKKCAAVPLAIRVIGSSLRDQGKSKWVHMAKSPLANQSDEDIMPVLKISYYDLPLHLKRCFSYCAIFPKDYKIIKENLIYLWMAHDFLGPNEQSLEAVGEEYFMKLLQRCFFQDVKRDDDGEIISCKMHDLIHDVAESIAGNEMMHIEDSKSNLKVDARHVFIADEVKAERRNKQLFCTGMKRMRTLLIDSSSIHVNSIKFSKARNLRALSWNARLMKAPKVIGELMHLRCLNFYYGDFSFLPPSITNLFNLQTLRLWSCGYLKMLPNDLVRLVNLRCLDLHNCRRLKYMPPGMGTMTNLQRLTKFVVANNKRSILGFSVRASNSEFDDLKCLKSLSGTVHIKIRGGGTYDATKIKMGVGCVLELEQLKTLEIEFSRTKVYKNSEALLECLQPNHNLRTLYLRYYPDVRFPSWGMRGGLSENLKSCLPLLVEIHLSHCSKLVQLPLMSQLKKLRALHLHYLESLEYLESNTNGDEDSRHGEGDELVFFPSLHIIELVHLPELKGWESHSNSKAFPHLNNLTIVNCDKLTTFPLCLNVESFHIEDSNYNSSFLCFDGNGMVKINSLNMGFIINSLPSDILQHYHHLKIQNLSEVKRCTREVFQSKHVTCLHSLEIEGCKEMRRLSELGEMRGSLTALEKLELIDLPELVMEWEEEDENGSNKKCENEEREIVEEDNDVTVFDMPWNLFASTLRRLVLKGLPKLVKLPRGLHCLTSLEVLELRNLPELELEWEEEDKNGSNKNEEEEIAEEENVFVFDMPWKYFASTLSELTLEGLPKMVKLPRGMHCLTSLYELRLVDCENLEELPAWIGYFTSLKFLEITGCKKLQSLPQEMCQLTSLQYFQLNETPKELDERCKKPSGADWPKIKHLPNIKINYKRL